MSRQIILEHVVPISVNLCLFAGAAVFLAMAFWFLHNLWAAFFVVSRMDDLETRMSSCEQSSNKPGPPGATGPIGPPGKCECKKNENA